MVDEILVQRDSVFCFSNVYPRCVLLQDSAALLQKQNVGGHFRTGIALERGIGQAYCADQVAPGGKILAHVLGLFIQCTGGCDERHNAADTQFIYRLGEEVIVNLEVQLIIPAVADLILSKRHIADGKVKEVVWQVGFFIPCNLNLRFLVKLLRDTTGQAIQLHAIQLGIVGIELAVPVAEERADTHAGFQHIAAHAADMLQGTVHSVNHRRRCVKGSQGGFPCGSIFVLGQQGFQLLVLGMPVIFAGVKGICQTTPAKIASQNVLFLLTCRGTTGCHALLDFFQRADGLHIGSELCFCAFRNGRFIRCKVVRAVILGRFLMRDKAVYILHDLRYKGGFFRFVCANFGFLFLDFVDVHFHQGIKIEY